MNILIFKAFCVFSPARPHEQLKTSYFEPPGLELTGGGDHHLTIAHIHPNSPAEWSGLLQVGDELVDINGQQMVGVSLLKANLMLHRHCVPMTITVQCRVAPEPGSS